MRTGSPLAAATLVCLLTLAPAARAELPEPGPGPVSGVVSAQSAVHMQTSVVTAAGGKAQSASSLAGLGSSASSAEAQLGPVPLVSVTSEKTGFAAGAAVATLTYEMRMTSYLPINPAALPVLVHYTALLNTGVNGASVLSNATAQLIISDEQRLLGPEHFYTACSGGNPCFQPVPAGPGPFPAQRSVSGTLLVPFDDVVTVNLVAQAFAMADNSANVSTFALVDPVFTLDPQFLAEHPGVSLVFSEGIVNGPVSGVPEPASAWALALGLAALAGRRAWPRRGAAAAR